MRKKTLMGKIEGELGQYLRSQFVIMVMLGAISFIILTLLGVKYPLVLAVITGVFSVVPVFGMTFAAAVATIIAIFDGVQFLQGAPVLEGLIIVGIYLALNIFSDLILSPVLVGKTANIHPLLLFFIIAFATALFGIVGTILAVPAILVARIVWKEYKK